MKTTILSLSLGLLATTGANIVFNHVALKCSENSTQIYHGCLRGQICIADGTCVSPDGVIIPKAGSLRLPKVRMRAPYSTDGTCGPQHGNTICDPNSNAYKGGCCSQYGWCGESTDHCGTGCISGCSVAPPATTTAAGSGVKPRADGRCGKQYNNAPCDSKGEYGGCCSQSGWCGNSPDHCLVSNGCQNGCSGTSNPNEVPTSTGEPVIQGASTSMGAQAQATAVTTVDGSCGGDNGDTVCGDWPNGSCCSMYGFCGRTTAHCGAGCQSGACLGPPAVPAPGPSPAPPNPAGLGQFIVVGDSGVPAMHAALMENGRVIFLDKLEDSSKLKLPNGRNAMSAEYDPQTNQVVPLAYKTNAFCAGGTFLADGTLVSLGGNGPLTWLDDSVGDGFNAIRWLKRSSTDPNDNGKEWVETNQKLASNRWYASAQTMPDGTVFVASGSLNGLDPTVKTNNNPTYEILNRDGTSRGQNIPMAILEKNQPYYMYPFLHLLRDGNVFVFTAKSSEIFNVGANAVVRELPDLVGDYRTYPNTGGSVMLPLSARDNYEPNIVVCGGGAYQDITSPTDASCGRIKPLSQNPSWEMDSMPEGRGMVEGTLLPDGTVLWLNGGNRGAQGFELMANPTLEALLYDPSKPKGQRWTTLARSNIPRLYHSVAVLMPDGTVMVTGSNPVEMPKLQPDQKDPYVTEYRVETFIPPYRQGGINKYKPSQLNIPNKTITPGGGGWFSVTFFAGAQAKGCKIVLHHNGFVTHSVHMGQRMVELEYQGWVNGAETQNLQVNNPPNNNVTPPGPYVLFAVVDGIPSDGQFVKVN